MSIEGMWCFLSGEVGANVMETGGVLILDTQRIFGGDSAIAYVGRYEINNGRVTGQAESFLYNPAFMQGEDVFGDTGTGPRITDFDLTLNDEGFLVGDLIRNGVVLPIVMQKLRELP